MKLYLSLTHVAPNIQISLRYSSTIKTIESRTITHIIDREKLVETILDIMKIINSQLKQNNLPLADIKYKGDPQFNTLLGNIFWAHMFLLKL